jgi:hypothetical protein
MDLNALLEAIRQLREITREQGIVAGSIPHVLGQFEDFIEARMQGLRGQLEERFVLEIRQDRETVTGQIERTTQRLERIADLAIREAAATLERKTTQQPIRAFDPEQFRRDVLKGAAGWTTTVPLENVELTPDNIARLQRQITGLYQQLIQEGISEMAVREGVARVGFRDALGRALQTEVSENGELVFRDAMGRLLGPDGTLAQVATNEAESSPNFAPAMEALLGPGGKLADSAREAAVGADLDPAFANLEEEIEQGVTQAMDEASDAAAGRGTVALGTRIGEGARALSGVLTSVPQLYESVSQLGEAWDKPLTSTKDYMDLFSNMGGVIGQGVETVQTVSKLAEVTKIASAAQAVFNAVMALNPVVLVVLAVLALVAAIVALIAYWDEVKAALRDNPWLAVVAALFGVIGVIVVVIAYWDEIKLAVLEAANFISIQARRIGLFFTGVGTLIKQVWDWIVDSLYNAGVGILNAFSEFGAWIVNLFIGIANEVIDLYNDTVAYLPGVDEIERIGEVEATRFETRQVQEISVEAAFAPAMGPVSGGLEEQIAAQRAAVAAGEEEDRARRAREAEAEERERRAREAERPALGAPPAAAGILPGRPGLPEGAAATGVDQSVRVEGGITVNINAERLEADAARLLSDEIVRRLKERLDALRNEQDFRTGVRAPAPA